MVNNLGKEFSIQSAVIYISILAISIIIFLLFITLGICLPSDYKKDEMTGYVIDKNNLKYLKIFSFALAYLAFTVIMYFSWMISYSFLDFNFLSSLLKVIFYILVITIVPGFILLVYILIANAVKDSKVGEALSQGLRIRG
jgi:hypothetical protein